MLMIYNQLYYFKYILFFNNQSILLYNLPSSNPIEYQ